MNLTVTFIESKLFLNSLNVIKINMFVCLHVRVANTLFVNVQPPLT